MGVEPTTGTSTRHDRPPRARRGRRGLASALAVLLASGLSVVIADPASAAPCDAPVTNAVLCENSLQGNLASEWDVSGAGDASIQGFTTDISVNRGQGIGFKVKTNAAAWRIDVYRLGYYGGRGARKQATVTPSVSLPQSQPACITDQATGLVDCGNWAQSALWTVPTTAVSGIYLARLVRTDTGGASHMIFVVRDDASTSRIFVQASDTTWQAYNAYGGNSLYVGSPAGRAYKVSYNRPFTTRGDAGGQDWVFNAEYPMIRFLESNGYDVSYTTGTDSDRRGALIKNHQTFLSVGHDEYWSGGQRTNVEAARAAGVNLAFFSGNEVFWKTRWENSIAGPTTTYRTLVTYKETHANAKIDPTPAWTGTWRDPRFSPPADGGRPENALTGQLFMVNAGTTSIQVPAAEGKLRLWRNTSVATLAAGATATFPDGTLGYEWDVDPDNGARPAGLVRLSSRTFAAPSVLLDYGSNYGTGTATHNLTLYRDQASRALVFGAGTVQWAWGLDSSHDRGSAAADVRMQQATVNLLADMGAQPASLRPGLVAAAGSTDATGPTVTITAPAAGATVTVGSTVAITGTATDAGGQVGAVEVSTDAGASWHRATGRASWSYSWTVNTSGPVTIKVRAADDSANLGAEVSRALNGGGGGPQVCPCTIWPPSAVPAVASDSDSSAVELGVKFRASVNGTVTGVRFYKGSSNTGTHAGRLWSSTGTQLATVNFTGESASGWQQATFATPVAVTAGVTYVVSYQAPVGRYSANAGYFTGQGLSNPPLSALASGVDGLNGVYHYGTGFPTDSYQDTNYWVDVVFSAATGAPDTVAPTVSGRTPASGATGVAVTSAVTATFSEPVASAAVTLTGAGGATVAGATTYDSATRTATFSPAANLAAGTTHNASVSGARDPAGNTMTPVTWSFTTTAAPPPDTVPPTVTGRSPAVNATAVSRATNVTAQFSEAIDQATTVFTLTGASAVPGVVTYDAAARTATFDPTADLAASTLHTVSVSGTRDTAGNTMAPVTWTFTTAATAGLCPCMIWPNNPTPANPSDSDTSAVELGLKFRTTSAGSVTGVRFYKGSGNTGTHIGNLWSATGTNLARITFTGETASGWQTANFSTPVTVAANTTYVISYFAPAGHYAGDGGYFATSGVTSGPLSALAAGVDGPNGVYQYGTTTGFPSSSYQSSNYWVDVIFS
jgi:hypothetical protein